jgi:uncharacterized membrane-anchored protein YhcB (DUF1043 family)
MTNAWLTLWPYLITVFLVGVAIGAAIGLLIDSTARRDMSGWKP